jgi:branched-chain amino acid transport system substrate-binding protein
MRFLAVGPAAFLLLASGARAEMSGGKVKIGVLTDLSGPYEQNSGIGSVEAAKMAAEEFGNKVNGVPVEIISADHQNKPDVGAAIARRWFDLEEVDAVTDLVNSAVGFAVLEIAKTDNKIILLTSAGSADFTGKACAPNNSVHWVYDSYEQGAAIGQVLSQLGKTWFFITADYVYGRALQAGATTFIEKNGGKVVGSVRHPLGTTDFSSSCCKRRRWARRWSPWRTAAMTPSTRSRPRASLASPKSRRWCRSGSTRCPRSAPPACSSRGA